MILSHQSSLIECEPFYSNFLEASDIDQVSDVPDLKEILVKGGKFYNECFYSQSRRPGQYFDYVNLNFIIAATIVEILSGQRFDVYQRENVLKHISIGLEEMATFDVTSIKNANNLGVIYTGEDSQWVPSFDYHPDGKIPPKNFTGYRIGSNGAVFAPQGSMRASVSHLTNYAIMLANLGVTKEGVKIISESSVKEMVKPKYHYHGSKGGAVRDFHQYGFGLYTTTYRVADSIISH
jgi:CubicO group peptidase (beta-lactamase class C family)